MRGHPERLAPDRMGQDWSDHLRGLYVPHDLWDDIAGALHDHDVALADILTVDVVLVMQCGLRNRDAAHLDRLQFGPGIESTGSTDANVNTEQLRLRGRRRPLEGPRPARPLVQCSQRSLLSKRVDLDHKAVDLVIERGAAALPLLTSLENGFDRFVELGARVGTKAMLAQPGERPGVRLELEPFDGADTVDPDRQRPRRGDARVELAQRAGGGVTRVRRGFSTLGGELLVQRAESLQRQVDLASHLDQRRWLLARRQSHRQWDRADRAQIPRHVLAFLAVAARGAAHEDAVLVYERDRRAVDLRLGHEHDRLVGIESAAHVLRPFEHLLTRRRLVE